MRFFGGSDARNAAASKARVARHSSGWNALRTFLKEQEGLRVLDIGPTSSTNINLLTSLGHSIYMADLVQEAQDAAWLRTDEDGKQDVDAAGLLDANLPVNGRQFDVVLLWDAPDYLPPSLVAPLFERLHALTAPGGRVLAFGHVKPENGLHRYHLREDEDIDVQSISDMPVRSTFTNRQMETLLQPFATYRFFLAKDNLREILVHR